MPVLFSELVNFICQFFLYFHLFFFLQISQFRIEMKNVLNEKREKKEKKMKRLFRKGLVTVQQWNKRRTGVIIALQCLRKECPWPRLLLTLKQGPAQQSSSTEEETNRIRSAGIGWRNEFRWLILRETRFFFFLLGDPLIRWLILCCHRPSFLIQSPSVVPWLDPFCTTTAEWCAREEMIAFILPLHSCTTVSSDFDRVLLLLLHVLLHFYVHSFPLSPFHLLLVLFFSIFLLHLPTLTLCKVSWNLWHLGSLRWRSSRSIRLLLLVGTRPAPNNLTLMIAATSMALTIEPRLLSHFIIFSRLKRFILIIPSINV